MSGVWITCPHCGEKRDSSNRYTSPANAAKDRREWKEQHESGACRRVTFASVKIAPVQCGADDCTGCQSVQTNEPNPILIEFRQRMEGRWPIGWNAPTAWLQLIEGGHLSEFTPAQIVHARRVLARLAALEGASA